MPPHAFYKGPILNRPGVSAFPPLPYARFPTRAMTTSTMTEADIQNELYQWCTDKNHPVTIDNCGACTIGKADLLSVTKARLVHEFEIKCTVADFERDFEDKDTKHKRLGKADNRLMSLPNYFWFATPPDLLALDDIPDYAGLMIVDGDCTEAKPAPRIHADNLTDKDRRYIERGLTYRYWDQRSG